MSTDNVVLSPGRARVQLIGARLLERAERCYVVAVLLVFFGVGVPLLYEAGVVAHPEVDPIGQMVRGSVLAFVGLYALARPRRLLRAVRAQKLSVCLALLAVASAMWSVVPGPSLRFGVLFASTTLFGLYLGDRFHGADLVRLLGWALGAAIVLSLVMILVVPGFGIVPAQGGARGAFAHKNGLGLYMVLGAVTLSLIAKDATRYRWIPWAGACGAVALLGLSRSGTGATVLTGLCAVIPLFHMLRLHRGLRIPIMIVAVLVGAAVLGLVVFDRAPVAAVLGKDATLTGRTELWHSLVGLAQRRPWLGYGFAGFWDPEVARTGLVRAGLDLRGAFHGHNGMLDLWLDLGLLGVATFTLAFAGAAISAIGHSQSTRNGIGLWPVSFLSFLFLYNITESALLREWGLWLVFVATVGSTRLIPWGNRDVPRVFHRFGRLRLAGPFGGFRAGIRIRPATTLGVRVFHRRKVDRGRP